MPDSSRNVRAAPPEHRCLACIWSVDESRRPRSHAAPAIRKSRSFPVRGLALKDLATRLQQKGPQENPDVIRQLLTDWAVTFELPDPGDLENGDLKYSYITCTVDTCAMWTLIHVVVAAVAARGATGSLLTIDGSALVNATKESDVSSGEGLGSAWDAGGGSIGRGTCHAAMCGARAPRPLGRFLSQLVRIWRRHDRRALAARWEPDGRPGERARQDIPAVAPIRCRKDVPPEEPLAAQGMECEARALRAKTCTGALPWPAAAPRCPRNSPSSPEDCSWG